tara:strand:- start:835 stop:1539 length:705 start_codon:yes stop_codon:yes gene_type:complete
MNEIQKLSNLPIQEDNAIFVSDSIKDVHNRIAKENKQTRSRKTPKKDKKMRKGKGQDYYLYIDRLTAQKWLDENYPLWSMEAGEIDALETDQGIQFNMQVRVDFYDKLTNVARSVKCWGYKEGIYNKEGQLTNQQYYKSAETDALKRCVYTIGGFADVYKPDEEIIQQIEDEDFVEQIGMLRELIEIWIKPDSPISNKKLNSFIQDFSAGNLTNTQLEKVANFIKNQRGNDAKT